MSIHLDKKRKPVRNTQMEEPELRKTPSKGKAGSLCISVWSINAGQALHELGLAESPFKAEVFGYCYVKYGTMMYWDGSITTVF